MHGNRVIQELEVEVHGVHHRVQVFASGSVAACYALTRFSDYDAIISDGRTAEEALARHAVSLPIAVSCRMARRAGERGFGARKGQPL